MPHRTTPAATLCVLLMTFAAARQGHAQATVNSTFVGSGKYSDAAKWSPNEVPNNTAAKIYNVTVPHFSNLLVDVNATIENLTVFPFLTVSGVSFTVRGVTSGVSGPPENAMARRHHAISIVNGGTFDAGSLSAFTGGTLRGIYVLDSRNGPATLRFRGADVRTLQDCELTLAGPAARITNETGDDALRNLTRIAPTASLSVAGADVSVAGPVTNEGAISVDDGIFHVTKQLANFDAATRTLAGGTYSLAAGHGLKASVLQFAGADIVTNAASLSLWGTGAKILDEAGRDGLRNFSRNAKEGVFHFDGGDFTTAGDFRNDGVITASQHVLVVSGNLTNFDPATRRLSGGTYQSKLRFNGADIVRNAAAIKFGKIFDENGRDATRNLAVNEENGTLEVHSRTFRPPGGFTNAGRVIVTGSVDGSLVPGGIVMPASHPYIQINGETISAGELTGDFEIRGGVFHGYSSPPDGNSSITGNLLIANGGTLLNGKSIIRGTLEFKDGATFRTQSTEETIEVEGPARLAGRLQLELDVPFPLESSARLRVLSANSVTGAFSNAPPGSRVPTSDGRGTFVVFYEPDGVTLGDYQPTPAAAQLLNLSTRSFVWMGHEVPIAGFIVSGANTKRVMVRAIGPSLQQQGVAGTLQNPTLTLIGAAGEVIASNDDWATTQTAEIAASGLAPADARESAIIATLERGAYTAVLRGRDNSVGVALVEVYDLSPDSGSKLANLSTRGPVNRDDLLIAGLMPDGRRDGPLEVVLRAAGPSLSSAEVYQTLNDPTLEVRNSEGDLVAFNDDCQIRQAGLEPSPVHLGSYETEAELFIRLPRANHTAIVRGKHGASGIALVEVYDLNR